MKSFLLFWSQERRRLWRQVLSFCRFIVNRIGWHVILFFSQFLSILKSFVSSQVIVRSDLMHEDRGLDPFLSFHCLSQSVLWVNEIWFCFSLVSHLLNVVLSCLQNRQTSLQDGHWCRHKTRFQRKMCPFIPLWILCCKLLVHFPKSSL